MRASIQLLWQETHNIMADKLSYTILSATEMDASVRTEIIDLCTAAYEESFDHLFDSLPGSIHLFGRLHGQMITHAAWVTRWLEPEGQEPLRTAYVEAVATLPAYQGQGFGTHLMQQVKQHILDYELGALSPSEADFYARLGWELWQGPLAIRTQGELLPTPDEEVMIMRLPRTPALDLGVRLTAEWRTGELW